MDSDLGAVLDATVETTNLEFKRGFDVSSTRDWVEIIKDIVAIANSGGGAILLGVDDSGKPVGELVEHILKLDPADITNKVKRYTDYQFTEFTLVSAEKNNTTIAVLKIFATPTPLVFTKPGTYAINDGGKQTTAFGLGTIYFRHGAKSEPASFLDLRAFVERAVADVRDEWLSNIRKVVEAPAGSQVFMIAPSSMGEDIPTETSVRVVDDPSAPAFRRLNRDHTHPYRQTELVKHLNERLNVEPPVTSFDIQCLRAAHKLEDKPQFFDQPKYGSPQYSPALVDWVVEEYSDDPEFFVRNRETYRQVRPPKKWGERFRR